MYHDYIKIYIYDYYPQDIRAFPAIETWDLRRETATATAAMMQQSTPSPPAQEEGHVTITKYSSYWDWDFLRTWDSYGYSYSYADNHSRCCQLPQLLFLLHHMPSLRLMAYGSYHHILRATIAARAILVITDIAIAATELSYDSRCYHTTAS